MPITQTSFNLYRSTDMPGDDTSSAGGAISSTVVMPSIAGDWFPALPPYDGTSSSGREQNQKVFLKNEHATDSMIGAAMFMDNAIDPIGSASILKALVSDTTDATDTTIRICGVNSSDGVVFEDIHINGSTSLVSGSVTWKGSNASILYIMSIDANTGLPKAMLNSRVSIQDASGTNVAYIPMYHYNAIGFITFGIQSTSGGTTSIANRISAPAGITFACPRTMDVATVIGSSGIILPGYTFAIWGREYLIPGFIKATELEIVMELIGNSGGN